MALGFARVWIRPCLRTARRRRSEPLRVAGPGPIVPQGDLPAEHLAPPPRRGHGAGSGAGVGPGGAGDHRPTGHLYTPWVGNGPPMGPPGRKPAVIEGREANAASAATGRPVSCGRTETPPCIGTLRTNSRSGPGAEKGASPIGRIAAPGVRSGPLSPRRSPARETTKKQPAAAVFREPRPALACLLTAGSGPAVLTRRAGRGKLK